MNARIWAVALAGTLLAGMAYAQSGDSGEYRCRQRMSLCSSQMMDVENIMQRQPTAAGPATVAPSTTPSGGAWVDHRYKGDSKRF